jgi:uncharacterized heparinase superfamily protein
LRERDEPSFFFDSSNRQGILSNLDKSFPSASESIVDQADKICEHAFDLLGSGPVKLKAPGKRLSTENGYRPIDWHTDFKTGYCWNPKKYYTSIERPYGKADIKVPWELSRFQHLVTLGQAYWLVEDQKYPKEFYNQIEDWIENNPYRFGVNWACTMDVAIRAVNWIFGFYFFADASEIPDRFWVKFLKSLFLHGRFILNNLEIAYDIEGNKIRGNHYLSNVVGLVFLGIFLKDTEEGKKWLNYGIKELATEMKFQVNDDGSDFESSIPYHRLVLELFVTSAVLCKINDIRLPREFWIRLERMFEFVMFYTKPDGHAPQIGDNDSGRLWVLSNYGDWDVNDHRYMLSIGAVLFNRPDFQQAAGGIHQEILWLFGNKGIQMATALLPAGRPNGKSGGSKGFPDSGYFVMRNDDNYMIISAGKVGTNGIGNHKHNDILSFELFVHGKSFIIDPGTYVYTADPNARNLFRSTAYHNTIQVDDEEINSFSQDIVFRMTEDANLEVNSWEVTDRYDFFDAEHIGYKKLSQPIKHRRQIYFDKLEGLWIIKDFLTGAGKHKFDQYFHFAPMDVTVDQADSLVVKGNTANTNIMIIPIETAGLEMSIQNGWISYSYGTKIMANIVRYSKTTDVPTSFITVLYAYEDQCRYSIGEIKQYSLKSRILS